MTTSAGTIQPTKLYSYDYANNITAICDENKTNAIGQNWPGQSASGADYLCPQGAGATVFSYNYPSYQFFGQLTQVTEPNGFHKSFSYNAGAQGGADYGQKTTIQDDAISQLDGSNKQSTYQMTYDYNGNVLTVNNGSGTAQYTFDMLSRLLTTTDADSVTSYNTYNPDGTLGTTQTAAQHASNTSSNYFWDGDGNRTADFHHYGNVAGYWHYFYDGYDRLIETQTPEDTANSPMDILGITRFYYDLSSGNGVQSQSTGTSFFASGNLFDTVRWAGTAFVETGFTSYDTADRPAEVWQSSPCAYTGASGAVTCSSFTATALSYDSPSLGQLGSVRLNAGGTGATKTFSYDSRNATTQIQYSGDGGVTPNLQYAYTPNGKIATITSSTLGAETFSYNSDDALSSKTETLGQGGSVISYGRYSDDSLSSYSVGGSLLSSTNLVSLSYRSDGLLQTRAVTYANGGSLHYTYTAAGRPASLIDFQSNPSQAMSYDANGQLSQFTIPAGSYTNFSYDSEGDTLSYQAYGGETVQATVNVRGELLGVNYTPNPVVNGVQTYPSFLFQSVQGELIQSPTQEWDARNGALLGYSTTQTVGYDSLSRMSSISGIQMFTYDSENRLLTGDTNDERGFAECGNGNASSGRRSAETVARSNNETAPLTYSYAPDGTIASDWAGQRWHYAGGVPLFTDVANSVNAVYVGRTGIIAANAPLTVADQETNGLESSLHNATGYGAWAPPNPYHQSCLVQGTPASSGFIPGTFAATPLTIFGDGSISDGRNTFGPAGAPNIPNLLSSVAPDPVVASGSSIDGARRSSQELVACTPAQQAAAGPGLIGCISTNGGGAGPPVIGTVQVGTGDVGVGGAGGGGGGGPRAPVLPPKHPLPAEPTPQPTAKPAPPCPKEISSVSGSGGFLVGGMLGSTQNGPNTYYTAGLLFTPVFSRVVGYSSTHGTVNPIAGQANSSVIGGWSLFGDAGFGIGYDGTINQSGYTSSAGLMTPTADAGFSFSIGPFHFNSPGCQ